MLGTSGILCDTHCCNFDFVILKADYEVVGDHVTAIDTHAPMRSRQLHESEVNARIKSNYCEDILVVFILCSLQHYLQTMRFSLSEHSATYHKVILDSPMFQTAPICPTCDR